MRRSSIAVAVFAALIVLLSSSPASAHATFVGAPGGFPTNTDQTLTMNVPHERDDVTYNVEFSGAAIGKMQTQKDAPPFDVTLLSRSFAIRAQNAGLVSKIGKESLAEADALIPDAMPAAGWGASMILDTFDLMIDTNQIKTPVQSWLDLWRPEFEGKLMLPAASNPATVFFIGHCR